MIRGVIKWAGLLMRGAIKAAPYPGIQEVTQGSGVVRTDTVITAEDSVK